MSSPVKRGVAAAVCCAAAAVLAAPLAQAQQYPTKPVRMIVPFPPGGSNDIVGRIVSTELSTKLGQQVVVDNRGGAGGLIGTELAATAAPDGHTLLIISVAFAYNPSLYKAMAKYEFDKSFSAVSIIGTGPNALTVNPQLPVKTVKELIAMAKAKPGSLNYASAGIGSFQHLSSEMLRVMAGINMVHVPFKGGGPAMADVMAGSTQICIGSLIQVFPFIRSGRLKVLATGGSKRVPALADVPTVAESGVPGYEAVNWWGILAPLKTPPAVIKKVHAETQAILASPDMKKKFEDQGAETVAMSPDEFAKFIRAETAKWDKVVKQAGIKAE